MKLLQLIPSKRGQNFHTEYIFLPLKFDLFNYFHNVDLAFSLNLSVSLWVFWGFMDSWPFCVLSLIYIVLAWLNHALLTPSGCCLISKLQFYQDCTNSSNTQSLVVRWETGLKFLCRRQALENLSCFLWVALTLYQSSEKAAVPAGDRNLQQGHWQLTLKRRARWRNTSLFSNCHWCL